MKKYMIATLSLTVIVFACKTSQQTKTASVEPPKPAIECTANSNVGYAADIKPIMDKYCVECHGNAGGYDLSYSVDVYKAAKNGDLLGVIKWQFGYSRMPAGREQLDQNTINKIECWINNGLKP